MRKNLDQLHAEYPLPSTLVDTDRLLVRRGGIDYTAEASQFGLLAVRNINVGYFGAVGDGVADDTAAIQDAIDYAESIGGGTVWFDEAVYKITATLVVDESNVMLRGRGRGSASNGKATLRASAATRLAWSGVSAGPMVKFTSDAANTGLEHVKNGGGIIDLAIDGSELCEVGLLVESWREGTFLLSTMYFTSIHWHLNVLTNGTTNSPADTQHCRFNIISSEPNTANQADALGVLGGTATANVSINLFEFLGLAAETSAVALACGNCDANTFLKVSAGTRGVAVGDGGKIVLHASDTLSLIPNTLMARYNSFGDVQGKVLAKAALVGVDHSKNNIIWAFNNGNGSANPVVETGATLRYFANGGVFMAGAITGSIIDATDHFRVAGTKVVGPRETGWTAMTGTGSVGPMAAAAAGVASVGYVQAELQAALNRIAKLEARMKSYDFMLHAHGLIGA